MLKIILVIVYFFFISWDIGSAARHHKDGHYYMFGVNVALACLMLIQLARLYLA